MSIPKLKRTAGRSLECPFCHCMHEHDCGKISHCPHCGEFYIVIRYRPDVN